MAPTLLHSIRSLLAHGEDIAARSLGSSGGPIADADALLKARSILVRREEEEDPGSGSVDPHDISNVGIFVLFALIGVAIVCTGIWFFFWAKNGGFHFHENDWDDYKSTVLRRKGPNGTVLSGATESTNLGGGSVYKDVVDDDGRTVVTESTGLSGVTAGASDIGAREKRKKKQEQRDRERHERRKARGESSNRNRSSRHVGTDGVEDEEAEYKAKEELRSYRHERPARVGGLNKESEGSQWDGSTNPTESTVESSLLSGRQSTPTSTPTKSNRGIRKVYSTADRNDRQRSRQHHNEDRVERRDFSYQRSAIGTESTVTDSLLDNGTDLGTKSYHHPMPELRAQRQREREERRARRGGYRRGRGDEEEEL